MDFLIAKLSSKLSPKPCQPIVVKLVAIIGFVLPVFAVAQEQGHSGLSTSASTSVATLKQSVEMIEQVEKSSREKSPMLIASPSVCELAAGTYLCSMKAALIWEMPKAGHYCLYEQEELEPLQCWQNQWSGSHVMVFESDKPVTYILRSYQSGNLLGNPIIQANINVIGTLEQRIRAKRRRRFLRIF